VCLSTASLFRGPPDTAGVDHSAIRSHGAGNNNPVLPAVARSFATRRLSPRTRGISSAILTAYGYFEQVDSAILETEPGGFPYGTEFDLFAVTAIVASPGIAGDGRDPDDARQPDPWSHTLNAQSECR
jgi:hypothetical protein